MGEKAVSADFLFGAQRYDLRVRQEREGSRNSNVISATALMVAGCSSRQPRR